MRHHRVWTRRAFLNAGFSAAAVSGFWTRSVMARAAGARASWEYDLSRWRRVDPSLIRYRLERRIQIGTEGVRRMAVGRQGRLYVAAGKRVVLLNASGEVQGNLAVRDQARCVAEALDGEVYVGRRDGVEIFKQGERIAEWAVEGRPFLTGIAVAEKEVYAADAGNRMIWRFDRRGKTLGRIDGREEGTKSRGFIVPSPFFDVKLGADGLLRVNNPGRHRVETYTADGHLEFVWGKPSVAIDGFCGCCNPVHLAVLEDGRCVTFEKGLPRVKVHRVDGTLDGVVAGPESFPENADEMGRADAEPHLTGLDGGVDEQNRIYILDRISREIHVMAAKEPVPGKAES